MHRGMQQCINKGREEEHCWQVNMDINNFGFKILQIFYDIFNTFSVKTKITFVCLHENSVDRQSTAAKSNELQKFNFGNIVNKHISVILLKQFSKKYLNDALVLVG